MNKNTSRELNVLVLNEGKCASWTLWMQVWNYMYEIALVFNIWCIYVKRMIVCTVCCILSPELILNNQYEEYTFLQEHKK